MTARGYEFYLTSERNERVRCRVEHEKLKFISTSGHVIFCLLHKHTNDNVFDDFPKISEDFSKLFPRKDELFRTFFGHFPKIFEEVPMMFRSVQQHI